MGVATTLTIEEWAAGNAPYRPSNERREKICEIMNQYQTKFRDEETSFETKMDDETSAKYTRLSQALTAVREVLVEDGIISHPRGRTRRKSAIPNPCAVDVRDEFDHHCFNSFALSVGDDIAQTFG